MNIVLKAIVESLVSYTSKLEEVLQLKTDDPVSLTLIELWKLKQHISENENAHLPEKETAEFLEKSINLKCDQTTHYWILGNWFYIALRHPYFYSELTRLKNYLLNISTQGLNEVIVSLNARHFFYYFIARERDSVQAKKYIELHLKLIAEHKITYYNAVKSVYVLSLPFELQIKEKELSKLFKGAPKEDLEAIPIILFLNSSNRLNTRSALKHLKQISSDFSYEPILIRIKKYINTLYRITKTLNLSDLNAIEKEEAINCLKEYQIKFKTLNMPANKLNQDLLTMNDYLHVKELTQATLMAKKIYHEYDTFNRKTAQTTEVYLSILNIELCNQNTEEAETLYSKYEQCYLYYNTDLRSFYQARIFLLKGDIEKAKKYFYLAREYFYNHDAKILFKKHIHYALEMTPEILIELFSYQPKKSKNLPTQPEFKLDKKNTIQGTSRQTNKLIAEIKKVSSVDIPVLILGETGTGKEVTAHAIHNEGLQKNKPFIAVNCSSISDTLIESELFGHVKGAFTGANNERLGLFESAKDGTIFLDEIGDISPRLQASLLRVLESNEIKPAGSSKTRKIKCRIIAATNANLENLVEEGRFRQDLLYRLNRYIINIEPLRNRPDDILYLTKYFLKSDFNKADISFTIEAEKALSSYFWPGNVRELRNVIERMYLFNNKDLYHITDLEDKVVNHFKEFNPNYSGQPINTKPAGVLPVKQLFPKQTKISKEESIKSLFLEHKTLTRKKLILLMDISEPTATTYLKKLVENHFIEKITPNASPRSHYFILR